MPHHCLTVTALAAGSATALPDIMYRATVPIVGVRATFVPTANTLSGAATLSLVPLVKTPNGTVYEDPTAVTGTLSAGATTVTTLTTPGASAYGPPAAIDGVRLKITAAAGTGTLTGFFKAAVRIDAE
jgi:hypothetical protein